MPVPPPWLADALDTLIVCRVTKILKDASAFFVKEVDGTRGFFLASGSRIGGSVAFGSIVIPPDTTTTPTDGSDVWGSRTEIGGAPPETTTQGGKKKLPGFKWGVNGTHIRWLKMLVAGRWEKGTCPRSGSLDDAWVFCYVMAECNIRELLSMQLTVSTGSIKTLLAKYTLMVPELFASVCSAIGTAPTVWQQRARLPPELDIVLNYEVSGTDLVTARHHPRSPDPDTLLENPPGLLPPFMRLPSHQIIGQSYMKPHDIQRMFYKLSTKSSKEEKQNNVCGRDHHGGAPAAVHTVDTEGRGRQHVFLPGHRVMPTRPQPVDGGNRPVQTNPRGGGGGAATTTTTSGGRGRQTHPSYKRPRPAHPNLGPPRRAAHYGAQTK